MGEPHDSSSLSVGGGSLEAESQMGGEAPLMLEMFWLSAAPIMASSKELYDVWFKTSKLSKIPYSSIESS